MITQQSFFFLSGLSLCREQLIYTHALVNAVHMGLGAFGNDFGTVAFTYNKKKTKSYKSKFIYLGDKKTEQKEIAFLLNDYNEYTHKVEVFELLPNVTFSYTISENTIKLFGKETLSQQFVSGGRNKTHKDDEYIRLQWEIINTNKKFLSCCC